MKKISFTIVMILCIACQASLGQQEYRESLKFSAGLIRFAKDDLNGFYFSNEYNKPLSRYLTVSPSVEFGHGTTGNEYPYSLFNKTSVAGNLIVNFSPFLSPVSERKWKLGIGVGPSLRYFSGPSLSDYKIYKNASITSGEDLEYGVPLFTPLKRLRSHNFVSVGARADLDLGLQVSLKNHIGVNFTYAKYGHGGDVLTSGINFSFLF